MTKNSNKKFKFTKRTLSIILITIFVVYLVTIATSVYAEKNDKNNDGKKWGWWRPLVPCGIESDPSRNEPCDFCHIFQLVKNLIDFFSFEIAPPLAAGFFTYTGILFLLSKGNANKEKEAKEVATKIVIGLLLIYGAWLIISTLMSLFFSNAGDIKETWWKIECKRVSLPPPPPPLPSATSSPTTLPPGEGLRWNETTKTSEQFQMFASPELINFTGCFSGKLKEKGLTVTVTAVADYATYKKFRGYPDGKNCFDDKEWSQPPCAHSQFSCHYGGKKCQDNKSYSLDIASTDDEVLNAARECGASENDARVEKGNHIHIDAPGADAKCDCPTFKR